MLHSVVFYNKSDVSLENAALLSGIPLSSIDLEYGLQLIDIDKQEYVFLVSMEQDSTRETGFSNPEIGPWQTETDNCN